VTSLLMRTPIRSQTNRKFYAPVSLLPENVVYRDFQVQQMVNPKRGLADALVLQPNFNGIGLDLKRVPWKEMNWKGLLRTFFQKV
jgi:hypothetical protein